MRRTVRRALGRMIVTALAIAAAGPLTTAHAATIAVNTTSDEVTAADHLCSLREAISTVTGSGNGDCEAWANQRCAAGATGYSTSRCPRP